MRSLGQEVRTAVVQFFLIFGAITLLFRAAEAVGVPRPVAAPALLAGTVHEVGAGVPGTPITLAVDLASSCTSALSTGWYRIVPVATSQTVVYCCRTGTTCTATTSSVPYLDGSYYIESVTSADSNDVICCAAASAGTDVLTLFVIPLTF